MHARLALALHASRRDELFDICSTHSGSAAGRHRGKIHLESALRAAGYPNYAERQNSTADLAEKKSFDRDQEFLCPFNNAPNVLKRQIDPTGEVRGYSVPPCIESSIRYMHFGSDFHIDESLTGFESRLFECNKGPDMSAHSYRDGKMKREIAADIMSFVGFKGLFEGSPKAARKHRLTLVYDSDTFDVESTVLWLASLRSVPPLEAIAIHESSKLNVDP